MAQPPNRSITSKSARYEFLSSGVVLSQTSEGKFADLAGYSSDCNDFFSFPTSDQEEVWANKYNAYLSFLCII